MIGRLVRWTFTALSAASLLACVSAACLWFHARRVYRDSADGTVGRTYVWATSDREGVSVWVIHGWPWPEPLRVCAAPDADRVEYYNLVTAPGWERAIGKNCVFASGVAWAIVGPDGTPPRESKHWDPMFELRPSAPMPAWVMANAPHWAIVALTSLAPLTWLTLRQRQRMLLRRRRLLGLCPHCGYDLRACRASGRCSECGQPILSSRGICIREFPLNFGANP